MPTDGQDVSIIKKPVNSGKTVQRIAAIVSELHELHNKIEPKITPLKEPKTEAQVLQDNIDQRIDFFAGSAKETIEKSITEILEATKTLRDWMVNRVNVRLIGAGRARLAGAIPANRLAHGGARAYIIDDLIPMPHSSKQGGIIAVSASGTTGTVKDALKGVRNDETGITIIGIADHRAIEFKQLCDIFIGIRLTEQPNPLRALADTEEYVISMLLDAMVVAAGKMAGFDDNTWRLGHENIGPTGPYDLKPSQNIELDEMNIGVTFLGREKDLRDLEKLFEEMLKNGENILYLYGEPGVGKRSLAYRFSRENYVRTNFTRAVTVTAYNFGWQELVVQIARKVLEDKLPPKATVSEMEQAVLDAAKKQRILLIIDNVDQNEPKLLNFLRLWANVTHSLLILTIQGEATNIRNLENGNCRFKKLSGIQEQWVIEDLVGKVVMDRFKDLDLLDELGRLGGNPEKLLYLRWRSPKTREEIEGCLQDLIVRKLDDNKLVIDPILKQMNLPLDHFLSLGRIRTTVFDEGLLAFIWDCLDRGGTELYTRTLRKLLSEGLLEWSDRSKLSMNTNIHAQLWNLAHPSGQEKKQLSVMDYFIAQYFRTRFANNRPLLLDLEALENYTYHYDRFGKIEDACRYIFDVKVIDEALARGRTLEIEPILNHLETGLGDKLRRSNQGEKALSDAEVIQMTLMLACVKMNLGHVCKDLSRHEKALSYLDNALILLNSLQHSSLSDFERGTLLSEIEQIEHYRAVAYSQVGRTLDCIESYLTSIKLAVVANHFGSVDALSLGYLAYELKFHDMQMAQIVGEWAVEISEMIGDRTICAKNLCSLGQILSFDSKLHESAEMFHRAEQLCDVCDNKVDERTRCRILVNSAVTFIGLREWNRANSILDEAISRFGESGDRRRKSMAKAYQGIILFHKGAKKDSQNLIMEALKEHMNAGAEREMIYEALTLIWMAREGIMPERLDMLAADNLPKEVRDVVSRALNNSSLNVFVDFWANHYRPALLDLSSRI